MDVKINEKSYKALLDTRASVSILSEDVIPGEIDTEKLKEYRKRVLDVSGNAIPIKGELDVEIETPEGTFEDKVLVYNKNSFMKIKVLLGMNVLQRSKIDFPNDEIKFNIKECIKNRSQGQLKITLASSCFSRGRQENSVKVCESPISNLEKGEMKLKEPEKDEMKLNEPEKGEMKLKEPKKGKMQLNEWEEGEMKLKEPGKGEVQLNEPEKGEMTQTEPKEGEMKLNEPEKGELKIKEPAVGEEIRIEELSEPQKGRKEARIAIKEKEAEGKIHLIEDLELKENCVTVTEIKVPRKFKENEQIVLHCSEHKGFVVANAVTKVKNGSIMINVLNLNDHALKLKQGTQLCSANRWSEQEVNGVSVEENKPQAVNKKDAYRPLTAEDINCGEKKMQEKLLKLLNNFRNICWIKGESLGKYTGDSLEIKLKEDVVVNKAPYRIPHAQQKQVDVEIKKMLDEGIISRSKSVFNSLMIIVPKPENAGVRLCLDMRGVNDVTVPIRFPIPRIADLLNSLNETKIISSIDLAAAYHQCEIKPEDRHKTAFTVNSSKYEYNRVAFGLTSAPGYFCRIINETLHEVTGSNVVVYMNDILVFSKDEETHLKRIEEVLKRLAEVNLKIKVTKCQFFADKVKFFGFTISEEGMSMDEGRIESLKKKPYPENKKNNCKPF